MAAAPRCRWLGRRHAAPGFRLLATVAAAAAGCSESGPAICEQECIATACGGPQPAALSECLIGGFFADCGGAGEPTIGCHPDTGDCRWFVGGCAPDGYRLSVCPADDICCRSGLPFDSADLSEDEQMNLMHRLNGLGVLPWDSEREMNLQVTVGDPPIDVPFSCQGEPFSGASGSPCTGIVDHTRARTWFWDYFVVRPEAWLGWVPYIEVDPTRNLGRVCSYDLLDVFPVPCPTVHEGFVQCTRAGTITLTGSFAVGGS